MQKVSGLEQIILVLVNDSLHADVWYFSQIICFLRDLVTRLGLLLIHPLHHNLHADWGWSREWNMVCLARLDWSIAVT